MSKDQAEGDRQINLTKILESTGQIRRSSVTPVQPSPPLVSPHPQRDLHGRIDRMSNVLRHTSLNQGNLNRNNQALSRSNQGAHQRNQSMSSRASPDSQGVRISNHSRGESGYQTRQNQDIKYSDRSNVGSGNASFTSRQDPASSSSSIRRVDYNGLSAKFLARLTEVQGMVLRCRDLPKDFQDKLIAELQQIYQQYSDQHRTTTKDLDRYKNERDELRRQLRLAQENNGKMVMEKKELEMRHMRSMEHFDELERRWKRIQEDLIDQIARQKEQIDGKRALWLDQNPGSSAKRDAMIALRDPFQSPSASQTPSYTGGAMSTMTTPSVKTPSGVDFATTNIGPPKYGSEYDLPVGAYASQYFPSVTGHGGSSSHGDIRTRKNTGSLPALDMRRGAMPTGAPIRNGFKKMPFPPEHTIYGSHQTFHTEPGTPPQLSTSNAVVVHKSDEEVATEYKSLITQLYELIEAWVRKYSSVPNQNNDRAIACGNDVLWDYMMNCTYPGHRQDSHTHVVTLLNNSSTRFWFVMRMATQYCVKDIMSIKAFRSYNKGVQNTIDMVLIKLSERGLHNEARQLYIDQGSEAIQAVMGAKNYQAFRAQQLGIHTKALRDMLGPLLDDGVTRASAGIDLGAIAVLSWDLSCKMHTARLTFQIYFPETNAKFTAATMQPKDLTNVDPVQLQIEQARLKLVITPVITLRDDRGTTIRAKNIHSAIVLLMK